jgi:hypothetical protein
LCDACVYVFSRLCCTRELEFCPLFSNYDMEVLFVHGLHCYGCEYYSDKQSSGRILLKALTIVGVFGCINLGFTLVKYYVNKMQRFYIAVGNY